MEKIIKMLIDIGAIKINIKNQFTWTSGILSPIYIDNRLIMSFPEVRNAIIEQLSKKIIKDFPNLDYLIGVATGGVPHAAYLSNILNLPMGYIRTDIKKHGKKTQIEGFISKEKNILVIEDLLSTGKSSLKAINILKANSYKVIGVASIFSYETNQLHQNLKDFKYISLFKFDDLLNVLLKINYISNEELNIVNKFIKKLKGNKE